MFEKRLRRVALVGALGDRRVMVQTAGHPMDPDRMLPPPDVVLLVADGERGAMLFRYTAHGELCGDTPHASTRAAEDHAGEEYGEALLPWMDVPADVADAHAFAVQYAAEHLDHRDERDN